MTEAIVATYAEFDVKSITYRQWGAWLCGAFFNHDVMVVIFLYVQLCFFDRFVGIIMPAEFQTQLERSTLLQRLSTLHEVANTAAFMASDQASVMTGTVVNLSCGAVVD